LVVGSLTSCDPSDVFDTIKQMAQQRIRVSVIGLAAGTKLCQTMSHDTGGELWAGDR
jgi:transcription initiation factor TFIIH subunit 2